MALAERPLLRSEAGDLAADDAGPEGNDRRKRPVEQQQQINVHDQRRLHPNSLQRPPPDKGSEKRRNTQTNRRTLAVKNVHSKVTSKYSYAITIPRERFNVSGI